MSEYVADTIWRRAAGEAFVDSRYSRAHEWRFDGGVVGGGPTDERGRQT